MSISCIAYTQMQQDRRIWYNFPYYLSWERKKGSYWSTRIYIMHIKIHRHLIHRWLWHTCA